MNLNPREATDRGSPRRQSRRCGRDRQAPSGDDQL